MLALYSLFELITIIVSYLLQLSCYWLCLSLAFLNSESLNSKKKSEKSCLDRSSTSFKWVSPFGFPLFKNSVVVNIMEILRLVLKFEFLTVLKSQIFYDDKSPSIHHLHSKNYIKHPVGLYFFGQFFSQLPIGPICCLLFVFPKWF